jgi:hypothetical protein
MVRDHFVPTSRRSRLTCFLTTVATDSVLAAQTSLCGGGRESNPPTDSRRRTGLEGRRGPFAAVCFKGKSAVWAARMLGAYLVVCSSVRTVFVASSAQIREHRAGWE